MVNKPVAPKTTRSYVRPCCLNPISSRCDMAAEIDQVKYVSSVNIHSAPYVYLGMDSLSQGGDRMEL